VKNDELHILFNVDLVQQSLQFFIVDVIEVLPSVCHLKAFVAALGSVVDPSNE